MYVAVKDGERAILTARALREQKRRGDGQLPELSVDRMDDRLNLAVNRVMTEGGIADRELAVLAFKQASDDNVEAIFLLRAYCATLPRPAVSGPTNTAEMHLERRIFAVYKDIPGGQLLSPAYDHTHRLLDSTLLASDETPSMQQANDEAESTSHIFSLLTQQGLAEAEGNRDTSPNGVVRTPSVYPCPRSSRLQQSMRDDEGYPLALAYPTQRDYSHSHPFVGEIRNGYVQVEIVSEELGFSIDIDELLLIECEMVNSFIIPQDEPSHFARGYGLTFGMSKRKAVTVALVDRALQAPDYDEEITGLAQDEESALVHAGNAEAAGLISHLKLPHYVGFQTELVLLRRLQRENEHG